MSQIFEYKSTWQSEYCYQMGFKNPICGVTKTTKGLAFLTKQDLSVYSVNPTVLRSAGFGGHVQYSSSWKKKSSFLG